MAEVGTYASPVGRNAIENVIQDQQIDRRYQRQLREQSILQGQQQQQAKNTQRDKTLNSIVTNDALWSAKEYNPIQLPNLQNAYKNIEAIITKNPNATLNDVMMDRNVQQSVNDMTTFAVKAKQAEALEAKLDEQYKGKAGIDLPSLKKVIRKGLLSNSDGSLKNPKDIDFSKVDSYIMDNAQEFTSGEGLVKWAKDQGINKSTEAVTDKDKYGGMNAESLSISDPSYKIFNKKTGKHELLMEDYTDEKGRPIKLISDNVYESAMEADDNRLYVQGLFNQRNKERQSKGLEPIRFDSEQGEQERKRILAEKLMPLGDTETKVNTKQYQPTVKDKLSVQIMQGRLDGTLPGRAGSSAAALRNSKGHDFTTVLKTYQQGGNEDYPLEFGKNFLGLAPGRAEVSVLGTFPGGVAKRPGGGTYTDVRMRRDGSLVTERNHLQHMNNGPDEWQVKTEVIPKSEVTEWGREHAEINGADVTTVNKVMEASTTAAPKKKATKGKLY